MHLTQCLELVTPFMQSGQTKQLEGIIDWWGVPLGMHVRTHDTLLTPQNIGSTRTFVPPNFPWPVGPKNATVSWFLDLALAHHT